MTTKKSKTMEIVRFFLAPLLTAFIAVASVIFLYGFRTAKAEATEDAVSDKVSVSRFEDFRDNVNQDLSEIKSDVKDIHRLMQRILIKMSTDIDK